MSLKQNEVPLQERVLTKKRKMTNDIYSNANVI